MSKPIVIPWLPSTGNTAAIASVQTLTAAGPLALNSTVPGVTPGAYVYDRVIRSLDLSAANTDLSGINFTITGIGSPFDTNGNPTQVIGLITETLIGPSANSTIGSANIYKQINSITASAAAQGISAGFGDHGITDYVFLDYNRTIFQTSLQIQFLNQETNNFSVTVYQTLSKPETPNIVFGNWDTFAPLPAFVVPNMNAVAVNTLANSTAPVTLVWANIMNSFANDSVNFTVLQQGI